MKQMKQAESFSLDDGDIATGAQGQKAHWAHIEHSEKLEYKFWQAGPGVWCMVGNGLSNQTFVEGPQGLIVIDTGESVEELTVAMKELRKVCQAPLATVIYTHFHYVGGTKALMKLGEWPAKGQPANAELPIWGHRGIVGNRLRISADLSAAAGRGMR